MEFTFVFSSESIHVHVHCIETGKTSKFSFSKSGQKISVIFEGHSVRNEFSKPGVRTYEYIFERNTVSVPNSVGAYMNEC